LDEQQLRGRCSVPGLLHRHSMGALTGPRRGTRHRLRFRIRLIARAAAAEFRLLASSSAWRTS
jgi:hypothetical protein